MTVIANSFQVKRSQDRINSLGYFQEKFEIKQVPGSAPGTGTIFVIISCMPSGAMSRREAKITASGTGLPVLVFISRTVMTLSGPVWMVWSTSSNL